jgi:hypothetical protein
MFSRACRCIFGKVNGGFAYKLGAEVAAFDSWRTGAQRRNAARENTGKTPPSARGKSRGMRRSRGIRFHMLPNCSALAGVAAVLGAR